MKMLQNVHYFLTKIVKILKKCRKIPRFLHYSNIWFKTSFNRLRKPKLDILANIQNFVIS